MRLLCTIVLLAGLFALTAIQPQAQTPTPVFRSCLQGGMLYWDPIVTGQSVPTHCLDPVQFLPKPIGGACTAPPVGSAPTIYAKANDGTCLPLIAVPPPGSIAGILTGTYAETAMVGQPVSLHYQFFVVGETPTPGSNLCPNPDGTLLIQCGPGQTPP